MRLETFFNNFELLADAPNGVQKLRELILQLAVQGKLTLQDPNDEPAFILLEKTKAKKERLIKEKKIKKPEPLSLIESDDMPYELPKGWEWVRLGEIVQKLGAGSTPKGGKAVYSDSGIKFLRSQNVWNDGLRLDGVAYITPEIHQRMDGTVVKPGDVLLNITGASIGRSAVVSSDFEEGNVSQHVAIVRLIDKSIRQYIHLCLISPLIQDNIMDVQVGISREGLSMTRLKDFLIPMPPFNETKRIEAKVDQLMVLCNELEARQQKRRESCMRLNNAAIAQLLTTREPNDFSKHWQSICDNFDLLYSVPENIGKLRQAILQLAVQGKLVPQDPNDEQASVLIEKIKAEREQLIKEKKINKSEPLPPIGSHEVPYELPIGWEWTRFPELGKFGRGKSKHRPRNDLSLYREGTYPVVQTGDVARANGIINTYTGLYNENGLAQSHLWPKGTLCITIAANIADAALLGFDACFPDSVVGFIPSSEIDQAKYFGYFMRTAKEHLQDYAPSTAQKNINLGILEKLLIPLPPKGELQRIVAKVDQLMNLCDELEAKLTQSQTNSETLMEAAARQVLGV